ncbi:MAG: DUF3526 domain-containing protein [Pseudomonadota bacterium]
MISLILSDLRRLTREKLSMIAFLAGTLCALLAAINGAHWIDRLETTRAGFLDLNARSEAEYRARFAGPQWTDVDSADAPYTTRRAFAYPIPLLADFTVGRSHLEPTMAQVRMGYRSDTLFKNYQIDNPERLQRGVFDLSFVVVVVAPLLLIGLGYGLFSEDRDSGAARLILVQSGGIDRLLAARSFNRLALVATPLLIATIILLAMGPEWAGRPGAAALWLISAWIGLLFWWAIILLINLTRFSAETAALALLAIWVVLVFVAPPLVDAIARSVHPPPSRMDQIIASRSAELDATKKYANDHPSDGLPEVQRVKDVIAEYHRISLAHERSIRPMSERFDERLAHQQEFSERLQLLSPPMALAATLADISGTGVNSYVPLRRAAKEYLGNYQKALSRGIADNRLFTLADHDALPSFEAPPRAVPTHLGVLWTATVTTFFFAAAIFRLRTIEVG